MTMEQKITHKGPIQEYELLCPSCMYNGEVEVEYAHDIQVLSSGVIGRMRWKCKCCGEEGPLNFFAEFSTFHVRDDDCTVQYSMERVE